jgi:hypothetical protein
VEKSSYGSLNRVSQRCNGRAYNVGMSTGNLEHLRSDPEDDEEEDEPKEDEEEDDEEGDDGGYSE